MLVVDSTADCAVECLVPAPYPFRATKARSHGDTLNKTTEREFLVDCTNSTVSSPTSVLLGKGMALTLHIRSGSRS